MKHCFLLLLLFAASIANAQSYDERDDVRAFVATMEERHGFAPDPLLALFRQTRRLDAVIRLIKPPADPGVRSWRAYRQRFIEPKRIAAGSLFMQTHAAALERAERRWGVPREIIAAIIGVETLYGRQTGDFGTFAALTTLAFDYPPRADLFRRELEELLLLAREEGMEPLRYRGSYAGALGLPQFLPSSRRQHAVDFDGDGRIDLLKSPLDAIGSVASFLANHGWQPGGPIADLVSADGEGLTAAIEAGIVPTLTPTAWRERGVEMKKLGAGEAALADEAAAVIDLVTPDSATEYRLAYRNFFVITRYNRSTFYASAVMDLAAALRQTAQAGKWARPTKPPLAGRLPSGSLRSNITQRGDQAVSR